MSHDEFNKSEPNNNSIIQNQHFQTPFKNTHYNNYNNESLQHQHSKSGNKFLSDLFSSGNTGGVKNSNLILNNLNSSNNNLNARVQYSGGFKSDCKCQHTDDLLKNIIYSPSSNFLFHSPSSLEKYIESYSRERINVMKIVKPKGEYELGTAKLAATKIIYEEKLDKENSPPNFEGRKRNRDSNKGSNRESNDNSRNGSEKSENKFLQFTPMENSLFTKIFEDRENNISKSKTNLMNKFEQFDQFGEKFGEKFDKGFYYKNKSSNDNDNEINSQKFVSLQEILNSPNKIMSTPSITSKRQIFTCSASKYDNSAQKSNRSSIISEPQSPEQTLFSTQKKNKRRLRKSSDQIENLKQTYKENSNKDWTKEMISEISIHIGLPENKVYKWLWDQKNKEIMERKRFIVYSANKNER